jgi:hypothetical protein
MLVVSSKPLPTLNSCQHSEALPSWHQELRYGVAKCAFEFARNNSDYQFFPVFSRRVLGVDVQLFGHLSRYTAPAIDTERHVTLDRGPTYDAMLVPVIVDRVMLRCAVIPQRNIAL